MGKGRPQGDRGHGFGALIGVPIGTYFLSRLEPVTTRWIISAFVFALLLLLLSGWRYRGKDHAAVSVGIGGLAGFCSGLAQTGGPPIVGYWLGRPLPSVIARANIVLFFGASDFFSAVSYATAGLITMDAIQFAVVVGPVYAHRRLVRRFAVRQSQRNRIPRDLLRADRGRGASSACPRWMACCADTRDRLRRVGKAKRAHHQHAPVA